MSREYRGIVSPAYVVQRPRSNSISGYLALSAEDTGFLDAKEAGLRWSTQYGITSVRMWRYLDHEHFKMIYACLPPLSEQAGIVRYLEYVHRHIRRYVSC